MDPTPTKSPTRVPIYTTYAGKKARNGCGAIPIDTLQGGDGPGGSQVKSELGCQQWCTASDDCQCVTRLKSDGMCFRRSHCTPAQFCDTKHADTWFREPDDP